MMTEVIWNEVKFSWGYLIDSGDDRDKMSPQGGFLMIFQLMTVIELDSGGE